MVSATGGKCFTVALALSGIPLFVAALEALSDMQRAVLADAVIAVKAELCCWRAHQEGRCRAYVSRSPWLGTFFWFIAVVLTLVCVAKLFAHQFDFTYGDSLYFTFISVTTIGFGDLSPPAADATYSAFVLALMMAMSVMNVVISDVTNRLGHGVGEIGRV